MGFILALPVYSWLIRGILIRWLRGLRLVVKCVKSQPRKPDRDCPHRSSSLASFTTEESALNPSPEPPRRG